MAKLFSDWFGLDGKRGTLVNTCEKRWLSLERKFLSKRWSDKGHMAWQLIKLFPLKHFLGLSYWRKGVSVPSAESSVTRNYPISLDPPAIVNIS